MQRILLAICLVFLPLVAGGGTMTQSSMFWPTTGIGDGISTGYSSDNWQWQNRMKWLNDPTTQGVSLGFLNDLEVTNPAGVTLRVASGGAIVYGFPYRNTADVDLALVTPLINTTGWRLVLRADWATQTVRAALLQSADGTAAAPGVTQTAGVRWEITLASGTITVVPVVAITDGRTYLQPGIEIDNGQIINRTRRLFVSASTGYNITTAAPIFREDARGIEFPDAEQCRALAWFTVPTDYVTGTPMTVTAVVIPGATGDIVAINSADYGACGESWTTHSDNNIDTPTITNGLNNCITPVVLTNIAQGDLVGLNFNRDAVNVLDTINNIVDFQGWYVDYTADM